MNGKILATLVVVTILVVGIVLLTSRDEPEGQVVTQDYLVPGLQEQLNQVQSLRLVGAGEQLLADLVRSDSGWVVANRDNYPADLGKVRETLLGLADSRLMEEKTSNPEFYERLGVSDVNEAEAGGTLLEITGLAEPVSLIIGDPAQNADGTYARRAGEARSWLASGALGVSQSIQDWLDTAVIDIPARDLQSLRIQHPDGELLVLEKTERNQTDFTVVDMPEGRELNSQGSANALGGVLGGLNLEDVLGNQSLELSSDPVSIEYRSFDGLVVQAEAFQHDEQPYVRFTGVGYDEDLAQRFVSASDDTSESGDGEASVTTELSEEDIASGQQRASELMTRLEGWSFRIASYQYENMTRRTADLLAPIEEPEPATEDLEDLEDLIPVLPSEG